jgi:SAM-dependent methyltransferase
VSRSSSLAGPAESSGLIASAELELLPVSPALDGVDLDLCDKNRVSALPWRGQFSPLTVARLIDCLALDGDPVLDPFMGSGTVLLEAARRGIRATGFDVNPAALALSKCACLASLEPPERTAAIEAAKKIAFGPHSESLLAEEPAGVAHALALLANTLKSESAAVARVMTLVNDLPSEPVAVQACLGDARATGLESGEVRTIITSPPYINVFNYHQYGRPMTDEFAWPILQAARSEIGSNRQNRGNRFRTVIQYSIDMALALAEMDRVLSDGGIAVLVVGRESRVRDVSFSNSALIAGIARRLECFGSRSRGERKFINRFGTVIREDVLVLTKTQLLPFETPEVEEIGRRLGESALEEAEAHPGTLGEIEAALGEAERIVPSPIAERIA